MRISTNNKTRSFPSPDFSGFGFISYFFLLSTLLLLNLRLLLSGPLYEELPPFLRSLTDRSSVPLLFSIIYDSLASFLNLITRDLVFCVLWLCLFYRLYAKIVLNQMVGFLMLWISDGYKSYTYFSTDKVGTLTN